MIAYHHPHRPTFPRHTLLLQQGKQKLLLFAVVALIRKQSEEFQQPAQDARLHAPAPFQLASDQQRCFHHAQSRVVFLA